MDKLIFGLSVTAVGMIIVFLGLTVLIFCLKAMNAAMNPKKKEPPKEVPVPAEYTPAAAPAVEPEPAPVQDDTQLAAVIAAAIAAIWQDENTGFVVRRIRRVNNTSAWQRAGREEQIYSRL